MYVKCYVVLCILFCSCNCARILGVFPCPGYSQYQMGSALMKALASRGHEVVVITAHEQTTKIKNYKEIVLSSVAGFFKEKENVLVLMSPFASTILYYGKVGIALTEKVLEHTQVQQLLNSNDHFDLVICEHFFNEAHMGFAHRFKAPLIIVSAMGSLEWSAHLVGNPFALSVYPNTLSWFTDTMGFKDRILNTVFGIFENAYKYLVSLPEQNRILKKYFPTAPELNEIMYNISLLLVNTNFAVTSVFPALPNVIEVGGMHISSSESKVPNELKTYLDEATEGVIYFGMGGNVNPAVMGEELSNDILKCLSTLNQRVLWKWTELPNVSKNVKIGKWFPQQDVLAHPNMRLMISHGGFFGLQEAIYNGIPIIGIPMFGDQESNIAMAVSKGYGLHIPLNELSGQTLCNAINEILSNSSYSLEARRRSKVMKDQPMKPLEKATFWIEYVINNKGAPYLRSSALNLNWFEYYLVDVILCMISAICVGIIIIIAVFKLLFRKEKGKRIKKD